MALLTTTLGAYPKPDYVPTLDLIAGPDCGLGMLDRATVIAKLTNMVAAAHAVG